MTVAMESPTAPAAPAAPERAVSTWWRHVAALTHRNLIHVRREPAQLSDATVQPVLFTVLFVYINFTVRRRNIEGYIAMLMDMPSLEALKKLLDALIRRTGGASQA